MQGSVFCRHSTRLLILSWIFTSPLVVRATPRGAEHRVTQGLQHAVQLSGRAEVPMSLEERMDHYRVPGVSIAVIDQGTIAWARGYGVREEGGRLPVTETTLFMVKSLSKPVTALAALRLVERGELAHDRPVNEQLLSWKVPTNELTRQAPVTLRTILSHTSGLTQWGVPSYLRGAPLPTLLQALNGEPPALERFGSVRVDTVPGTRWRYSGGAFTVLQQLLMDVTGTGFPELMRELVFDPLGMPQSFFLQPVPPILESFTAVGHGADGAPIEGRWETLVQLAAGGMLSTSIDLAHFVMGVDRAWQGKSELLTAETAQEMLSPHPPSSTEDNTPPWGLGFELPPHDGSPIFSHTGSGDGFKTIFVGLPGRGQGAVVLTNGNGGGELRYELLRSIAREYKWPAFAREERTVTTVPASELEALVGVYEYPESGAQVSVTKDDGELFFEHRSNRELLYTASKETLFTLRNLELQFRRDSLGRMVLRVPRWGGNPAYRSTSSP